MSVERLAATVAEAIRKISDTRGVAEYGVYSSGQVTISSGTFPAVKAVPVNLYDGKQVWVQLTESGTAVIIGD